MSYIGLGSRQQLGAKDVAGASPYLPGTGWVVSFAADQFSVHFEPFEVYHIELDGPLGIPVKVRVNNRAWDTVQQGWQNSWDPAQPMILGSGDQVDLFWNTAFTNPPYNLSSNIQPEVTVWLRYDPAVARSVT